jgi:hypothetical protein
MTSTFTTNKTLELPANGDYVNTWNIPVNSDMTVIDTALGGTTNLNATAGSATLTYTQYRPLILSVTGAVSANVTYTIPSGVGGQWIVRNAMTDASGGPWDLIFASGGGGTSVIVSRGFTTTIYSDGTNISYSDSRLSTAAGSNRQIQYNNNGVLGAAATFVYDASGNVGIGTASPSSKLFVQGASIGGDFAAISIDNNSGGSGTNTVSYNFSSGGSIKNSITGAVYGTGYLAFATNNNTEKMRIDASGNVGIGTALPVNYGNTYTKQLVIFNTDQNLTLGTYYQPSTLQYSFINSGNTNNANPLPLLFQGGGIERMRINSTGNVGIGTTSPGYPLDVNGLIGSKGGALTTRSSAATSGFVYNNFYDPNGNVAILCGAYSDPANYYRNTTHIFGSVNGATEYMRLDPSGVLLLSTTGQLNGSYTSIMNLQAGSINGIAVAGSASNWSSMVILNASNSLIGYIGATQSNISFNNVSDYRLKKNVTPLSSGLTNIQSLKPVTYDWTNSNESGEGFLAHELQAFIPNAVTGEKDAVDNNGNIKPQSVDYSKLVVHLVAAIQELSAKNDTLEARLAKLENAQ